MNTQTILNKRRMGNCLFCRKKMLVKDFYYCEECPMGEMCKECAIEHKKAHDKEKDLSITIVENVIAGTFVEFSGNNTFL